jgi:hypothetical protein
LEYLSVALAERDARISSSEGRTVERCVHPVVPDRATTRPACRRCSIVLFRAGPEAPSPIRCLLRQPWAATGRTAMLR